MQTSKHNANHRVAEIFLSHDLVSQEP